MDQKIRVGFRGFGRIGRAIFKLLWGDPRFEIIGILVRQSEKTPNIRALELQYDPHYGEWNGHEVEGFSMFNSMSIGPYGLVIDGTRVPLYTNFDSAAVGGFSGDVLIDCSGELKKKSSETLDGYRNRFKKIIITSPAACADVTLVYGVNHQAYHSSHTVVSCASCTTNCLVPIVRILQASELFQLVEFSGVTIHSATRSQDVMSVLDQIVGYSTGASGAIESLIPELAHLSAMSAVRVPVGAVSCLKITCVLNTRVPVQVLQDLFLRAGNGSLRDIVETVSIPLKYDCSGYYRGNAHSAIVNLQSITGSKDGLMRNIAAWYDNEWAYSCRVRDVVAYIAEREGWVTLAQHEYIDEYIDEYIPPFDEYQENET